MCAEANHTVTISVHVKFSYRIPIFYRKRAVLLLLSVCPPVRDAEIS